jgi:hypothetical protein
MTVVKTRAFIRAWMYFQVKKVVGYPGSELASKAVSCATILKNKKHAGSLV